MRRSVSAVEKRLAFLKSMNLAGDIEFYEDFEKGFWPFEQYGIEIVKLPGEPPEFYLIDHETFVGKGNYGQIFKAYPIDIKTGQVQVGSPFIVKKIEEEQTSLKKIEAEQQATSKTRTTRHIRFENYPVKSEKNTVNKTCYLFFIEYLPGNIAFDADENLLALVQAIKEVGLESRLTAIIGLLSDILLVQSESQAAGPAFLHGDVNQRNILIRVTHLSRGGSKATASLIDNGEAQRLPPREGEFVIVLDPFEGQPATHGTERFFGKMGPKSDIYSSVIFIAFFLGCQTPFKNKREAFGKGYSIVKRHFSNVKEGNTNDVWHYLVNSQYEKCASSSFHSEKNAYFRQLFFSSYHIDDILSGYRLSPALVKVVKEFVNRMQALKYRDRPDVGKALEFFTLLECALKDSVSSRNDSIARLILMASGHPAQEKDVLNSLYCEILIANYEAGDSFPLLSQFAGALLVSTQTNRSQRGEPLSARIRMGRRSLTPLFSFVFML